MFDKNRFKAKMIETGNSVETLAPKIGINAATLYRKIAQATDFYRAEIEAIKAELRLTVEEVDAIFFAPDLR